MLKTNKMDSLNVGKSLFIGSTGFAVSEIATPILQTADLSGLVQIVVQIVIGVATLISMFKKKKQ